MNAEMLLKCRTCRSFMRTSREAPCCECSEIRTDSTVSHYESAVDPRRAEIAERVLVSILTSEANVLEQYWPDAKMAARKSVAYADELIAELDRRAPCSRCESDPVARNGLCSGCASEAK